MSRNTLIAFVFAALCRADVSAPITGEVQIRLLTGITSHSRPGTGFQARVIGPVVGDDPALPRGSIVEGVVRKAHSVGLGIRRERALIELEFQSCRLDGLNLPCSLELLAIDNARERVRPGNTISGVLAASHAHSWFNGIWYRPAPSFARRAVLGLMGTAGSVQSRFAPTPFGAGLALTSKLMVMRMPDPEIELRAGAEFIVRATRVPQQDGAHNGSLVARLSDSTLASAPAEIRNGERRLVQDIIHLAFVGSRDDVMRAFAAAGWFPAEQRTARAIVRTYGAFAAMKTHETAPVSGLFYGGRLPELVFQKSFNSVSKRHHIRIWKDLTSSNEPLFLGAATHDVAIAFRWNRLRVTHEVDPQIDKERTKVINDLADAGCIASVQSVERPGIAAQAASTGAITDGQLYVVRLRECSANPPGSDPALSRRPSVLARLTRRMVLETRQYFVRGNIVYWGIRGVQTALRKEPKGE